MAAEVLVKAQDDGTAMGFSRGAPIDVQAGGFAWGRLEGDPSVSYIVVITDAEPEQIRPYLVPQYDTSATPDPETGEWPILRPRRYFADGTPLEWRTELAETGRITLTWAEIRQYVIDKSTGASQAGVELEAV